MLQKDEKKNVLDIVVRRVPKIALAEGDCCCCRRYIMKVIRT